MRKEWKRKVTTKSINNQKNSRQEEGEREREGGKENFSFFYLPGDISDDGLPVIEGCLEGTALFGLHAYDFAPGPQREGGREGGKTYLVTSATTGFP